MLKMATKMGIGIRFSNKFNHIKFCNNSNVDKPTIPNELPKINEETKENLEDKVNKMKAQIDRLDYRTFHMMMKNNNHKFEIDKYMEQQNLKINIIVNILIILSIGTICGGLANFKSLL